jgi:ankyrin repeat protein
MIMLWRSTVGLFLALICFSGYGMEGKKGAQKKKARSVKVSTFIENGFRQLLPQEVPTLLRLCFRALAKNAQSHAELKDTCEALSPLFDNSLSFVTEFMQEATHVQKYEQHLALKLLMAERLLEQGLEEDEKSLGELEIVKCIDEKYSFYKKARFQKEQVSGKMQAIAKAIELIEHVLTAAEYQDRAFLRPLACACFYDCWLTVGYMLKCGKEGEYSNTTTHLPQGEPIYTSRLASRLDIFKSMKWLISTDKQKALVLSEKCKLRGFNLKNLVGPGKESFFDMYAKDLLTNCIESDPLAQQLYLSATSEIQFLKKESNEDAKLGQALKEGDLTYIQQLNPAYLKKLLINGAKKKRNKTNHPILYDPLGFTLEASYLSLFEIIFKLDLPSASDTTTIDKLLEHASNLDHPAPLKALLSSIAVSKEIIDKKFLLHKACFAKNIEMVKFLLEHGASLDQLDWQGGSPLHSACVRKYGEEIDRDSSIAQLLLDRKASVNMQDNNGSTPLHYACNVGAMQLAQLLIEHGATLEVQDKAGRTPFIDACEAHGRCYLRKDLDIYKIEALITYLVEKKPCLTLSYQLNPYSKEKRDLEGFLKTTREFTNPAVKAIHKVISEAITKGQHNLLEYAYLIGDGWLCNILKQTTQSLWGNNYLILYLLSVSYFGSISGVASNANLTLANNDTLLHLASVFGNTKVVQELVKVGASVNAQNEQGNTPLHLVCMKAYPAEESYSRENYKALIDLLLLYGADVTLKNNEGYTSLMLAMDSQKGRNELGQYLKSKLEASVVKG